MKKIKNHYFLKKYYNIIKNPKKMVVGDEHTFFHYDNA